MCYLKAANTEMSKLQQNQFLWDYKEDTVPDFSPSLCSTSASGCLMTSWYIIHVPRTWLQGIRAHLNDPVTPPAKNKRLWWVFYQIRFHYPFFIVVLFSYNYSRGKYSHVAEFQKRNKAPLNIWFCIDINKAYDWFAALINNFIKKGMSH